MLKLRQPDIENRFRNLAMLECGQSKNPFARHFGVARSTISRHVRLVRDTGTFPDMPCSGTPHVTTVRQDNWLR